jgi:hypothetical protein
MTVRLVCQLASFHLAESIYAVKFGFILFIGDKVGIMQKARISVHAGAVKDFIGQFHIDITATSTSELSDDILARKIQDTSGSGTRVLDEVLARAV